MINEHQIIDIEHYGKDFADHILLEYARYG